jgi:streptogramin lyase
MMKTMSLIVPLVFLFSNGNLGRTNLAITTSMNPLSTESAALHTSINAPRELAYDPSGVLYISEVGEGRIARLDIARGMVTAISTPSGYSGLGNETMIAMGPSHYLFMATLRGEVTKLDVSTGLTILMPPSHSLDTSITSISSDQSGGILGVGSNQLFHWTPAGKWELIAGSVKRGFSGDGGLAVDAAFSGLMNVTSNRSGDIFLTDFANCRIRKIDSRTRHVTTIAGNGNCLSQGDDGPARSAGLRYPGAITCDDDGNLFFAEESFRIRRIDKHGVISTYAGTGEDGFSGDGSLATNARLEHPSGLVADKNGNLYIADYASNRIRRVDITTRFITTVAGDGSPKRSEVVM